jgi:hypothetical protein
MRRDSHPSSQVRRGRGLSLPSDIYRDPLHGDVLGVGDPIIAVLVAGEAVDVGDDIVGGRQLALAAFLGEKFPRGPWQGDPALVGCEAPQGGGGSAAAIGNGRED